MGKPIRLVAGGVAVANASSTFGKQVISFGGTCFARTRPATANLAATRAYLPVPSSWVCQCQLRVSGSGFGTTPGVVSVSLGSSSGGAGAKRVPCTLISVADTAITCNVTAGVGKDLLLRGANPVSPTTALSARTHSFPAGFCVSPHSVRERRRFPRQPGPVQLPATERQAVLAAAGGGPTGFHLGAGQQLHWRIRVLQRAQLWQVRLRKSLCCSTTCFAWGSCLTGLVSVTAVRRPTFASFTVSAPLPSATNAP